MLMPEEEMVILLYMMLLGTGMLKLFIYYSAMVPSVFNPGANLSLVNENGQTAEEFAIETLNQEV